MKTIRLQFSSRPGGIVFHSRIEQRHLHFWTVWRRAAKQVRQFQSMWKHIERQKKVQHLFCYELSLHWYSFPANQAMNCSKILRWLLSACLATVSSFATTAQAWTEHWKSLMSKNRALKDADNSGVWKHPTNITSILRLVSARPACFASQTTAQLKY